QDKKGLSGKQMTAERRAVYQRHLRPSSMLAKVFWKVTVQYRQTPISEETHLFLPLSVTE
ncbi:doublesex- and mab-3-related transcription factor 2-like, partial [Acipenser oxyrinchus oxyrinchus]